MKVTFDAYGCCMSTDCKFRKECAQHDTAGDYRAEDGFTPRLTKTAEGMECQTYDEPLLLEEVYERPLPRSWPFLSSGFTRIKFSSESLEEPKYTVNEVLSALESNRVEFIEWIKGKLK